MKSKVVYLYQIRETQIKGVIEMFKKITRDRALFVRCTAEERQEIKIKLNILKEKLKCQTLVETVLVLIDKEISKNK